jgi:hypothetical protein
VAGDRLRNSTAEDSAASAIPQVGTRLRQSLQEARLLTEMLRCEQLQTQEGMGQLAGLSMDVTAAGQVCEMGCHRSIATTTDVPRAEGLN